MGSHIFTGSFIKILNFTVLNETLLYFANFRSLESSFIAFYYLLDKIEGCRKKPVIQDGESKMPAVLGNRS